MGASASLIDDTIPADVKTLLDVCERQKTKISEAEADLVEKEMAKMFKGHNSIIDRLTGHTKSQLQRLFLYHASTLRHIDELVQAGNLYAKFIKQLVKTKEELEWEAITTSTKPDYDEELLVEIIGCSTTEEIQNLDQVFTKEKSFCLADLFAAQTKPDSQLRHFIERVLRFDRDESKTVDKNLAIKQASIIHKAGAARLIGLDEEPILEILSTASRAQCAAINEAYIDVYKMKLERAINMKFKGNCGKLMVLWTQPIASAIVTCSTYLTQKLLVDKNAIINFFAKYEKDILSAADEASKTTHKKSLAELVNQGISGTLHRAVKGWIELPTPDKGFERILDLYIKTRVTKGVSVPEMMQDPELKSKIHFLIEKQAQEMKLYMIDHKIKLDPGDQAILAKSFTSNVKRVNTENSMSLTTPRSNANTPGNSDPNSFSFTNRNGSLSPLGVQVTRVPSSDDEGDRVRRTSGTLNAIPELIDLETKRKAVSGSDVTDPEYQKKSTKVYEYLVEEMEKADVNCEGSLSSDVFWSTIKRLPIKEMGFTENELDVIRKYSQWETDKRVFYYEVLFEFGDSVIASIEAKKTGDNDVLTVIKALQQAIPMLHIPALGEGDKENEHSSSSFTTPRTREATLNSSSTKFLNNSKEFLNSAGRLGLADLSTRKGSVYQYPNIPIYFRQYLLDTLTAFDLDCNGYLTDKEIEALLEVINMPHLAVSHFFEEGVDSISPKEASDVFLKSVNDWFTDGTEHYVCLVDRDSGAYFWYNTLDGTTQWAETDGANNAAEVPQPLGAGPGGDGGDSEGEDGGFGQAEVEFIAKSEERGEEKAEVDDDGVVGGSSVKRDEAKEEEGKEDEGKQEESKDSENVVAGEGEGTSVKSATHPHSPSSPRSLKTSQSTPDVRAATEEAKDNIEINEQ